jgi:3-phenylpropionate/trans-cinnamate dioxygenase ferredoxin reductase component
MMTMAGLNAGSTVVIVGGGVGGLRTAEALRRHGFTGRITLLGAETHPPYDRPVLSKEMLTGLMTKPPVLTLRPDVSGESIETRLGVTAVRLHPSRRVVELSGGGQVRYDRLVIATGAHSRHLPGLPETLHRVREHSDALRLRGALASGGEVVIIGGGFIGCEVASGCRALGLPVTIVEAQREPLAAAIGMTVASRITSLHERHGVRILRETLVKHVTGEPGNWRVEVGSGETLAASIVVEAVGAAPADGWLRDAGIALTDGVVCDQFGRTSAAGVYAVGDVASWLDPRTGRHHRQEHWTAAVEQADVVARNMLAAPGAELPYASPRYVWSDQHGVRIQALGVLTPHATVELFQDDDDRLFAVYTASSRVTGVVAVNHARVLTRMRPLVERSADMDDVRATLGAVLSR